MGMASAVVGVVCVVVGMVCVVRVCTASVTCVASGVGVIFELCVMVFAAVNDVAKD